MKKIKKFLAGSWMLLSLLALFPGVASANGNLTIVVKNPNPYTGNQSWFTYERKPGETISDVATVKNFSDKPLKAHVYAVDATSNDSGSFILKLENEERNGVGKWTKLTEEKTVTIPPQQSVDFPFQIEIPETLEPGQYFGGIVLEEVSEVPAPIEVAAASETGQVICCTNIMVKTRIGLRIYLTIPGVINDSMEWSGFRTVQQNRTTNFQFEIKNTGNVALEPVATIEIFDGMGNQVDRFEKSLGESLPGTTINPVVAWENQALFGNYKAVGKLKYKIKSQTLEQELHGSAEMGTKTAAFTVVPWNLLLGMSLFALGAFACYAFHLYSRRQLRMNWEPYEVKAGDNIMNIAKNRDVDWKKIARVNRLKAPYLLEKGKKLRVPKKTDKNQPGLFDDNGHA